MDKIFGTDGIRGKAFEDWLTLENVEAFGRALATSPGTVVIGRDTRESGPALEQALVAGLTAQGSNALLLGVLPTPGVAHAVRRHQGSAAVVISASHNPFGDNGLKVFGPDGYKLNYQQEALLEKRLLQESQQPSAPKASAGRTDSLACEQATQDYIQFCLDAFNTAQHGPWLKHVPILLDCANGAAFHTSPAALRALGATVRVLHAEPNGRNINQDCGCASPTGLEQFLQSRHNNEIGLIHDGDADRLFVCDETGSLLDGDDLLCIAAADMAQRGVLANNTLVVTVMSNAGVEESLAPYGISVERTSVGDRWVIDRMQAAGYNLGGEQSGHLIFGSHSTTGDGLMAALALLEIRQRQCKPLSELRKVLQKYPQAQTAVRVREKIPLDRIPQLQETIREAESVLAGKGRILCRYSGTETKLRLLVEGKSSGIVEELLERLKTVAIKTLG